MTTLPANLRRFADFMAAHPSPEGCIAGRRYMVPCISHPELTKSQYNWGKWVPLIGTVHQDIEHVGFDPWHIHADTRFLTVKNNYDLEPRLLSRVVTLSSASSLKGLFGEMYSDICDNALLELRRLQCRRPVPPAFPETRWSSALQEAYAGCRIADGLCPHRGIPIACGRHVAPGVRQCPGHGLAWDDDGRQVRMVAREPAVASGAVT